MRSSASLATAAVVLSLIASTEQTFADRWLSPAVTDYYSPNRAFRLRITPATTSRGACTATLYERKFGVWYGAKWTAPLSNDVAPVSALVSDSGKYIVTFDNWSGVGYGDDVVVIYDGFRGKLRWKYRLEDILNNDELCQVTCSVSSRWWARGKHAVDESTDRLLLSSVTTKAIDLKTGRITSTGAERLGADKLEWGALTSRTVFPCRGCEKR